jgi:hypothetical protein
MTGLMALWLPILLSAVIVFVASSIIHMFLPWHRSDYGMVPNQDKVMDALRPFNIAPGDYMLPRPANMADMRNPEFIAKLDRGPKLVMTVMPNGHQGMGKTFVQWFLYAVVVSVLAAYVAGRALPPGTVYLHVFLGRPVAPVDLVSAILVDHHQGDGRRPDLRAAHRRRVRLAVAPVTVRRRGS